MAASAVLGEDRIAMYPNAFFSFFPPFPQDNRVFVAMSFAAPFDARWKNVIEPAIRTVQWDRQLEPFRVDTRVVSDSILTEILAGIARSRLIMADITQIGSLNEVAVRNANVMYEVGLSHAMRRPEEVLLFRSDSEPLLFDVVNVRVNHYDPDGQPNSAKERVRLAIESALKEVDLTRHLAVKRAAAHLDHESLRLLAKAEMENGLSHPATRTMRDVVSNARAERAMDRLLELDAIGTDPTSLRSNQMMRYHMTPFGRAILAYVTRSV